MISQSSFGARVDNAKKIWVHLATFIGYTATGDLSLISIGEFISLLERHNVDAASKTEAYSSATELRRRSFKTDKDSLAVMASRVTSKVSSKFGAKSRQAKSLQSMVNKLNGYAPTKKAKPSKNAKPAPESEGTITSIDQLPKSISRREAGLGSKLKIFADLVATVKSYGADYVPENPELTIAALEQRLAELSEIHKNVTATYSVLRQTKLERVSLYTQLTDRMQRVKAAVKSDFTAKSVEYKMIKGISV